MTPEELLSKYGPASPWSTTWSWAPARRAGHRDPPQQLAAQAGRDVSVCVLRSPSRARASSRARSWIRARWPSCSRLGIARRAAQATGHARRFLFLDEGKAKATPGFFLPDCFRNHGNYIVSLGAVTRWLAQQAEALGVEIFPGFAATEVLYDDAGAVRGVAPAIGLGKDGEPTPEFQLGMELLAKYTIFAEGARGHLGRQLIAKYRLDEGRDPQSYGIGIKELWQADPPGTSRAWWCTPPAGRWTQYLWRFVPVPRRGREDRGRLRVGLDYANPYLSPFEEFQRWKTHPAIRRHLRVASASATARAITAGGCCRCRSWCSRRHGRLRGGLPQRQPDQGSHAAIKTGMLAAEAAFARSVRAARDELVEYPQAFESSWLHAELRQSKNFKQWFKKGRGLATLMTGIEQWLLPRLGIRNPPWTLHRDRPDHACLEPAARHQRIAYPKPDGVLTFDRLSSVFLSSTIHDEDQPSHLTLKDASVPVEVNLAQYAGPEARYCPAAVYEFVGRAPADQLRQLRTARPATS